MKYKNIIIDSNNLYERNYHIYINKKSIFSKKLKINSGGIYGFIKSIQKLKREYLVDNGRFYFLFDNFASKINLRKEIDPAYKSNRVKKDKIFYKGLDTLQYLLLNYLDNGTLIYRSQYEADDIVKPLILSNIPDYENVLLVSEDLDWSRMINYEDRVIHWLAKNKIYNKSIFFQEFNYDCNEKNIVLYKAITGDSSDAIPPALPYLRKNIVLKILKDFEDVFDLIKNYKKVDYLNKYENLILENKSRLQLNHKLVSFIGGSIEDFEDFIFKCNYNEKVLKYLYDILGFDRNIDDRINYYDNKNNDFFIPNIIKRI